MAHNAHTFFTHKEKERIQATTKGVESRTVGEVAVMVVDSSDHYFEAEVIGGILVGSLLSLWITASYFHSSMWWYVPLSFLLFFPSRVLFRKVPSLKAALIGPHRKEHAVRLRAVRAFHEKGLYKTRKNTGVLFFISLLERKVRILADTGIHEKIGQEMLDKFARHVSRGIKEGRGCDALCEAIQEAGDLLARHFPITKDDTDELCNNVITE
jgi:putative membrane protein